METAMPRRRMNQCEMSAMRGPKKVAAPSPRRTCAAERRAMEGDMAQRAKPEEIMSAAAASARGAPQRSTARPMTRLPTANPSMQSV
jgi:hypothetical protein